MSRALPSCPTFAAAAWTPSSWRSFTSTRPSCPPYNSVGLHVPRRDCTTVEMVGPEWGNILLLSVEVQPRPSNRSVSFIVSHLFSLFFFDFPF